MNTGCYYCFIIMSCLLNTWNTLPIWYEQSAGQRGGKNWKGQGGCSGPKKRKYLRIQEHVILRQNRAFLKWITWSDLTWFLGRAKLTFVSKRPFQWLWHERWANGRKISHPLWADKPCRRRSRWSLVRERSPIPVRWGWPWCCWDSIPSYFLGKTCLICRHDGLVSKISW